MRALRQAASTNYLEEIKLQRRVWETKPVIRWLYRRWYADCVAHFSDQRPVVEIGAGSGNFKSYFSGAISSDLYATGDWVDVVMDAHAIALASGKTGNIFAFDVLHHLQRPLDFLREAIVALKPGGRLVLCEPAITPWSRFVYGVFHHEPVDMRWNLFALDGTTPDADATHSFANAAIPELLFWKNRARTLALLPSCRLIQARKFGFLLYPMTGGFGYRSLVPQLGFNTLQKLEDLIMQPFACWLTGMRMMVVVEKIGS